jgi:SprT protein
MQRNVKQEIIEKVEESFLIAEKFFNKTFERPRNIIFKRNGATGGSSNYNQRELMFQLDIAEHNADDFIKQVVPHEVAHYVQRAVYGYVGVTPHGREWKYIMSRVYKLSPDRCHSYDVSVTKTRKRRRFMYSCGCSTTHDISSVIHNRIQSGKKRYTCNACRQVIKYNLPIQKPAVHIITLADIQRKMMEISKNAAHTA